MDDALPIAAQDRGLWLVRMRQRGSVRRWALAAALGAAAMAASAMLVPHPAKRAEAPLVVLSAHAAVYEPAGGAARARVRTLKVGDRLPASGAVRTAKGGRLTLITRRGSEFTLNANSELALAARDTGLLRRGEVYCRSRAGEIKLIDTPAGKVYLLGTVIDAAAQDSRRVAVTVVTGKVRLSNAHGEAVVGAGQRSLMVASAAPAAGVATNILPATAWYDGRGSVVSDFGDIAYAVSRRQGLVSEIWAMKADGSNKHRVKSFLGFNADQGSQRKCRWLPGQQWMTLRSDSACWTDPDFEARRGEAEYWTPDIIVQSAEWLVDAATGRDVAVEQLTDYDLHTREISPDGTRLAFTGAYLPDPNNMDTWEVGSWVYDLLTGQVRKLLNGYTDSVAWSPDSRWMVAAQGSLSFPNHPLVLVDTDTGKATDLRVQGLDPRFSPDGSKLTYWNESSLYPATGVFVLDLKSGGEPRRIAPAGARPRWSPDGTRIVYWVYEWVDADTGQTRRSFVGNHVKEGAYEGFRVFVTPADGSGATEIYHTDPVPPDASYPRGGAPHAILWAPGGDAVYYVTWGATLVVAADGSGRVSNLGGSKEDSILPAAQGAETETALKAVQEAVFQYAVGELREFEGKPDDARAVFQASADIFAALPYEFPLADFSVNDVLRYADQAQAMADRPAATVLAESCRTRMHRLVEPLLGFVAREGRFPATLSELKEADRKYLTEAGYTKLPSMMLGCPDGGPFVYIPPPAGQEIQLGAVVIACPQHADSSFVWSDRASNNLGERRCYLASLQRKRDPQLEALRRKATNMKESADIGLTPWEEVEAAYAALVNQLPDDMRRREELGRMYCRRSAYEEALRVLPPASSGLWPWTPLTRAFCLDALGRRAEALALYQRLQRSIYPLLSEYGCGPTTSAGAWARLGLKQPTWPMDLDTAPLAGEVRLMPTTGWHVSSSPAPTPPQPELAIDGNPATPWLGRPSDGRDGQATGTWFQLDLGAPQAVSRILLDHQAGGLFDNDWPRALEAWGTADGATWAKVPVTQAGPLQGAEIRFHSPALVRAVRFVLTADHEGARDPEYWRISEVHAFGPARQHY